MATDRDTVLVLTNEQDHAADAVACKLTNRAIRTIRWDPGNVPGVAAAGAWFDRRRWKALQYRTGAGVIDLARVGVVWVRRPSVPVVGGPPEVAAFVVDESASLTNGLWSILAAEWINDLTAGRRASSKPLQLQLATSVGWKVPLTYIGNDPVEVRRLRARCGGQMIMKPFTTAAVPLAGTLRVPYTRLVGGADLRDDDAIWRCPAIWQEAIPKAFELRITVVGDHVLAGAIDSQASTRTRDDWRRYDFENVAHAAHDLPEHIRAQALALVSALGLRFGAIDAVVRPDGQYVFLEINPFGQWLWMEQLCGLPIADAHAALFASLLSDPHAELQPGSPSG
ncbi:MAG: RimK domain-containing protein ATP-grasp [Chloroflexi bacterium]|nr:RimK domain-containing protein ATP-grasp [Chloroflexota bacterium]